MVDDKKNIDLDTKKVVCLVLFALYICPVCAVYAVGAVCLACLCVSNRNSPKPKPKPSSNPPFIGIQLHRKEIDFSLEDATMVILT